MSNPTEKITAARFIDESHEEDEKLGVAMSDEENKILEEMAKDNPGDIKTREAWTALATTYAEISDSDSF
jgi:hypothetical protein